MNAAVLADPAAEARQAAVSLDIDALSLRAGGRAGERLLFGGLTGAVRGGERWVVVGRNGAGKSSLLAAIAGVFPIAGGEVRIDGACLSQWRGQGRFAALAARRAWCPQFWSDPFPATVAETASLARDRGAGWRLALHDRRDPAVDAMLARLDLTTLADADAATLSGGERQRLAIATTLLQGAPLLLLDEPASHLDPAHQRLLVELLHAHAAGGGAVVASLHDLDLAWDVASHAIVLDGRGGAVAGRRDEVLTAERLGDAFGVPIEAIDVRGALRFVVGTGAGDGKKGAP